MDRQTKTWHIHNIYAQPDAPADAETVTAVGAAVRHLANCLGATQINWGQVPSAWAALFQT
jgi:uncharacterized protein YcaQ